MREALVLAGLAAWGAVGWRFRGGAFAKMTGWRFGGTDVARAVFGGLWMAAPCLWLDDWRTVLLAPTLFLALKAEGWGGYMAMGREYQAADPRQPYDTLLGWMGLGKPGLWHDLGGMSLCGAELAVLPAALAGWVSGWAWGIGLTVGCTAWMPLAYAAAQYLPLPRLGDFVDDRTVWGEVLTGAALCPALFLALGG